MSTVCYAVKLHPGRLLPLLKSLADRSNWDYPIQDQVEVIAGCLRSREGLQNTYVALVAHDGILSTLSWGWDPGSGWGGEFAAPVVCESEAEFLNHFLNGTVPPRGPQLGRIVEPLPLP